MKHKTYEVEITEHNPSKETLTISVGPFEELPVSYDDLAHQICEMADVFESLTPITTWLGKALFEQTCILEGYVFTQALVELLSGTVSQVETRWIFSKKR